jgi:hypothetical protein
MYDALFVPDTVKSGGKTFKDFMTDPRMIRFFVDVQNKTRLETNMQAAGVLPSLNSFEARAMRVVVSSAPCVVDYEGIRDLCRNFCRACATGAEGEIEEFIDRIMASCTCAATCLAASSVLAEIIYNSVTTLVVGEKIMIEMPTYFFPSGAGVSPGNGTIINHGQPDPMATFRFAEPVRIEPQQNFRVEMLFPQGVPGDNGVPGNLATITGPLRIWVVLDGYLTRDVQ